ncbi:dTDP-glucose 4,6-dehydratase [Caldisphaera sp.]|uniref:dTDP-glucose 4,6-dehydratase n=1 Tax=Caldisphaera sp. TaxID=2060322 RepID=UPI0025C36D1C|nr:NAD-dependent epimerase/dehydratase family protein [Caldisphaera sp.]
MGEKFLVLGGAGFIGSAVVNELHVRGIKPLVFDKLTYAGRIENLINMDYQFIRGDIASKELEDTIKEFRPDIVINLAAETHVDRSIQSPHDFLLTNVMGVVNILELSRKYDFKFMHISTDEVYGDSYQYGCANKYSTLRPSSPYSASKASADNFLNAYVRTYGIDAFIARPSNNFGPRQFPEKLVPKTIIRGLLDMVIPIYGDGSQKRDWIYVEDTARILVDLSINGKKGEIYNIPGKKIISNLELVKIIEKNLNIKLKLKYVKDRPGHDKEYCMETDINYETTEFEEGIKKTIYWYLNNRWWWQPLLNDYFFRENEPWEK